MSKSNPDVELADAIAECYSDPLRFVRLAFPWGEEGPLKDFKGPDVWQLELLQEIGREVKERKFNGVDPVKPIRFAIASGHGTGKSTLAAWIVCWLMSTRPYSMGTVTANTFAQLSTKTWAAIQTWMRRSITGHWFIIGGDRIYYKGHRENWFASATTSREEKSEGFAGQHAANSSSWYLFDESSAVPEKIWEVAEGGLTDGESHFYALGNATRNNGKFHRICFGNERSIWNSRSIDSRTAAMPNKAQIDEWIRQYGEDSDFVRVRVRGLPPAASDLQFIDQTRIFQAQQREALFLPDDPLIVGVDVARGGSDRCVIRFRRGLDARSIPPVIIPGEESRDSTRLISKCDDILATKYGDIKPTIMFVDGTGIGGPICDRLKQLGHRNVVEIQFAAVPPDDKFANMRSYMWGMCREWLAKGAIDSDSQLETDLGGPSYYHNKQDKLLLESKEDLKKRGLDSPDHGDALALTFARRVAPLQRSRTEVSPGNYRGAHGAGWME